MIGLKSPFDFPNLRYVQEFRRFSHLTFIKGLRLSFDASVI